MGAPRTRECWRARATDGAIDGDEWCSPGAYRFLTKAAKLSLTRYGISRIGTSSALLHRTGARRGAMQELRLFDIRAPPGPGFAPPAPHGGQVVLGRPGDDSRDSMDNEQINAIGAALADLSERTEQLRGYL